MGETIPVNELTKPPPEEWHSITPAAAVARFTEPHGALNQGIRLPLNEVGEECPWPWEPQQLLGAPLGQYHCPYCGAMVIAGFEHLDYREVP